MDAAAKTGEKRRSLRNTGFFADTPDEILDKIAEAARVERVAAGQAVCRKDAPGDSIYVIMEGSARVHDGDLILATIGRDASFGELSTFEDAPCSASVTAESDLVLLRLDRDPLFEIMARVPGAGSAIARSLCRCLRERTDQVMAGAHYSKTLERELEIGREIQSGFLPATLPETPGWEIAAWFRAAREVAGDFYDAFEIAGGNRIGLVVGDVCDKGVGAALFMTLFRSLLRASIKSHEYTDSGGEAAGAAPGDPAEMLGNSVRFTNNYIARTHGDTSMFATLFFGLLEPESGHLFYINAGHEEPLIAGPKGLKGSLRNTGPAVGLFAGADFEVAEARLEPGDTLFAYTDGVTDAANLQGEPFTARRLEEMLDGRGHAAPRLVENVAAAIQAHAGDARQFDDITMLAVTRELP